MPKENLKLDSVIVDPDIQQRANPQDELYVRELAEVWKLLKAEKRGWKELPIVFKSGGSNNPEYVLAGGHYRFAAMRSAGELRTDFDVRPGTRRDAWIFALGDNSNHGRKRTPGDVRKAINNAVNDDELARLSDREVAKLIGIDPSYFSKVKREIKGTEPDPVKSKAAKASHAKPADDPLPFDDVPLPPPPSIAIRAGKPQTAESEQPEQIAQSSPLGAGKPQKTDYVRDQFGRVVPGWLLSMFEQRPAQESTMSAAGRLTRSGTFKTAAIEELILIAVSLMSEEIPHCICPKCSGHGCQTCSHRGWLTLPEFNRMPANIRAAAEAFDPANQGEIDDEAEQQIASVVKAPETYQPIRDDNGKAVPDRLRDVFGDKNIKIAAVLCRVAHGLIDSATEWNPHIARGLVETMDECNKRIEGVRPSEVCSNCSGDGCDLCFTSGFMPFETPEAA